MGVEGDDEDRGPAGEDLPAVLREMRRRRLRRRLGDVDRFEAFYTAYVTALVLGLAAALLAGAVGDAPATAEGLRWARLHGPGAIALVAAGCVALGLRSGSLGGPIALESAEVLYVLLAPVSRAEATRAAAWRSVRFSTFAGCVAGAVGGLVAMGRLPGGAVPWVVTGTATGAVCALLAVGAALTASGLRLGKLVALAAAGIVVAGTAAGCWLGHAGPLGIVGDLALLPVRQRATGWLALPLAAGVAAVGLRAAAGLSIEQAHRRSTLVSELRFAVTMQDLRTTILLRRQLAQEVARRRPWVRRLWWAPARLPVWRRAWRGMARWPAVRPLRMVVCGAAAGASAVGFWRGADELIAGAALFLWLAGLDATESLGQEVDHPDRGGGAPVRTLSLYLRHLPAAAVAMVVPAAVALAVLVGLTDADRVRRVVLLCLVSSAGAAALGAGLTVVQGPPPPFSVKELMVPPEAVGMQRVLRSLGPVLLAGLGLLPVLLVRLQRDGVPVGPVISVHAPVLAMGAGYAWWTMRQSVRQARG